MPAWMLAMVVGLAVVVWVVSRQASRVPAGVAPTVESLSACLDQAPAAGGARIAYPLPATVFPPDLAPPTVRWFAEPGAAEGSDAADTWLVRLTLPDGQRLEHVVEGREFWPIPAADWARITGAAGAGSVRLDVAGVRRLRSPRILCRAHALFEVSRDRVEAPIFYRDVNLPFVEAVRDPSTIRWRFGAVSSVGIPPVVLEGLPVCGNCHSFSKDGTVLGMDVDYANDKGSYAIVRVEPEISLNGRGIITWRDYRPEEAVSTFGLLSQVSPDGRYVVSTVRDRSVFVPMPGIAFSQLFFPIRGILAVYDRGTGLFRTLAGADDPAYVQSNPVWSPDGEEILFARREAYVLQGESADGGVLLSAQECVEFTRDRMPFRYDLYRVPFHAGRGGVPRPVEGASGNGMSNYFPRFSPDGRWIVFCRASSYMLLQPDSELWIVPAAGGTARRLSCNTPRMNSWHSWSPNGRWLVFASKALAPCTQLFLTHIDAEGNSSPPVLLEHFTAPDRAANIPEFVNASPGAIARIREEFLDAYSFLRAGIEAHRGGALAKARENYEKALALDPNHEGVHLRLGMLARDQGRLDDAIGHYRAALRCEPHFGAAHLNLGEALSVKGAFAEAETHCRRAAEIGPGDPRPLHNLAVVLAEQGHFEAAAKEYRRALERYPGYEPSVRALDQLLHDHPELRQAAAGDAPATPPSAVP
ncbi:MAG: tetratricopeptide repeat protein [Lentisphaeria bacterium]|nr:tetratricopeptide repeat protein [Lentisphaeria bacterium]